MNEFWNLDPIYMGFEDPNFEEDLSALKKTVAEAESFVLQSNFSENIVVIVATGAEDAIVIAISISPLTPQRYIADSPAVGIIRSLNATVSIHFLFFIASKNLELAR
jgi:hypothetical protein